MSLQVFTGVSRGVDVFRGDYMGLKGVYRGLEVFTMVYRRLEGFRLVYRGLLGFTGVRGFCGDLEAFR